MKKVIIILFTSIICLTVGTVIVYYNTASLGYDNAVLFRSSENEVRIMDFVISKKEAKKRGEEIAKKLKPDFITI